MAVVVQSFLGQAGVKVETTPGNYRAPTAAQDFLFYVPIKVEDIIDDILDQSFRGLAARDQGFYQGFRSARVTITQPLAQLSSGHLFKAWLGQVTDTGAGDPFTHAFTELDTGPPPTYSISVFDATLTNTRAFTNCILQKLTLKSGSKGLVTLEAVFIGKFDVVSNPKPTAIFDTAPHYLPWQSALTINTPPATAPVGATASGGALATGTYTLQYTFVTSAGETTASPLSGNIVLTSGNQQISVSAVTPLPPWASAVKWYFGAGSPTTGFTVQNSGTAFTLNTAGNGAAAPTTGPLNTRMLDFQMVMEREVEGIMAFSGVQDITTVSGGRLFVTGTVLFAPSDNTEIDFYRVNTQPTVSILWTNTLGHTLTVQMTKCAIINGSFLDQAAAFLKWNAKFQGIYNSTDTGPAKITLLNSIGSGSYN